MSAALMVAEGRYTPDLTPARAGERATGNENYPTYYFLVIFKIT